jgi:hypothetical protein
MQRRSLLKAVGAAAGAIALPQMAQAEPWLLNEVAGRPEPFNGPIWEEVKRNRRLIADKVMANAAKQPKFVLIRDLFYRERDEVALARVSSEDTRFYTAWDTGVVTVGDGFSGFLVGFEIDKTLYDFAGLPIAVNFTRFRFSQTTQRLANDEVHVQWTFQVWWDDFGNTRVWQWKNTPLPYGEFSVSDVVRSGAPISVRRQSDR